MIDLFARENETDMQRTQRMLDAAERTIQRQAAEGIDLHAQVAALQAQVRYWRERALHCAEIEPEGT